MISTFVHRGFRRIAPALMVTMLTLTLIAANFHTAPSHHGAAQLLTDSAAVAVVGSSGLGCTALGVGVGAVIGLAAGGVTLGFGAALGISVGLHIAAIACAA